MQEEEIAGCGAGMRRPWFGMGWEEGWKVRWCVEQRPAPRPLTPARISFIFSYSVMSHRNVQNFCFEFQGHFLILVSWCIVISEFYMPLNLVAMSLAKELLCNELRSACGRIATMN